MALPFSEVSTLLSRLEDVELQDPPILNPKDRAARITASIESWFKSHRRVINELDVPGSLALISTLLPERRIDRVYEIQAPRLCKILSRSLSLNASRAKDLQAHKHAGGGDLATCLQRVLAAGGPAATPSPTLGDVDNVLNTLASQSRYSGPGIARLALGSVRQRDQLLDDFVKRLTPVDGKWFVRLILKNLSPVRFDDHLVLKTFHFLLPDLLKFQNDLGSAIELLKTTLHGYPETCDVRSERLHRQNARANLKPAVGIKIGRPEWTKARSIDQCMTITAGQRWVLERKYDGEYCEVHIDLSRSTDVSECVVIFSKSGKNSTADRNGLIQSIVDCLRLGKAESKVKRRTILLGEMVVYSDLERRILPFEKIRKHVTRSGSLIGTDQDSQPSPNEHLAIVFFDILLLDEELLLNKSLDERRMWLRQVYTKIPGRTMSSEWKIVDFSDPIRAKETLVTQFAASIAERCEGLILKPCDVPYFAFESDSGGRMQTFIKLKKDYIAGLGDEADFAVVGASYNAQQASKCGVPKIHWTAFHLGCLVNRDDVLRFDAKPRFKIVGMIQQECCIPKSILQTANEISRFSAVPFNSFVSEKGSAIDVLVEQVPTPMDVVFTRPFVFEVLGSGFEKPSNCNFFMLRHSRVKKLHLDRSWKDCISFHELQSQALKSREAAPDSESQETRRWIDRLEKKCRKKFERQRTKTPSTARTFSAPSKSPQTRVSFLDGTTLVGKGSSKRKRASDPKPAITCPASKRSRPNSSHELTSASPLKARVRPSPLAEITNTADSLQSITQDVVLANRNRQRSVSASLHHLTSLFCLASSSAASPHPSCEPASCPFANSTVYLTPCIARTPYITLDLIPTHSNLIIVSDLACWDREARVTSRSTPVLCKDEPAKNTHDFDAPLSVVDESQAFEGMKKIVLVEGKRTEIVDDVQRMLRKMAERKCLGDGKVEVWDWRILESWTEHGA